MRYTVESTFDDQLEVTLAGVARHELPAIQTALNEIAFGVAPARKPQLELPKYYISSEAMLQYVKALIPHNKILAIKFVRDVTSLGLKESKDFVDSVDL